MERALRRAGGERRHFDDAFDVDLTQLDPVVYSGMYHSIGKPLGRIGDFS